jgi:hypothetical protein
MNTKEYLVIPKEVFESETLSSSAKILYAVILLYSRREGYCWATNRYFSSACGCSQRNVSRLIAQLISAGFVRAEEEFDGKIKKRRLYIVSLCSDTDKNVEEGTTETSEGYGQKQREGVDRKGAYINNKYKNNNYNYNNKYGTKNNFKKNDFCDFAFNNDDDIDYEELERIMRSKY